MSASSNISSHFIEQDAYYDADTVGEIMTPHRAGNYGNSWGRLDGGGGAGGPRYNEYDETVGPPCDSSDNVAWLLVSLSMLSRGNFALRVHSFVGRFVRACALSLASSLTHSRCSVACSLSSLLWYRTSNEQWEEEAYGLYPYESPRYQNYSPHSEHQYYYLEHGGQHGQPYMSHKYVGPPPNRRVSAGMSILYC